MQIEIRPEAQFLAVALAIGFLLAILWLLILAGFRLWQHIWNWINDGDGSLNPHPVVHWLMLKRGYTRDRKSACYPYQRNDGKDIADGSSAIWGGAWLAFLMPLIVALSVRFYPVTLTVMTLYLLARLARFARRHKKLFDKHLKDPEAHK